MKSSNDKIKQAHKEFGNALLFAALALLIVPIYVAGSMVEPKKSSVAEVKGLHTSSADKKLPYIDIVDNGDGSADLIIKSDRAIQITGTEVYFSIDGDLEISEILCSSNFSCIEMSSSSIVALRPLDAVETGLTGEIKIAKIIYTPGTSGTITLNPSSSKKSLLTILNFETNQLDPRGGSFVIGK